MIHAERTGKSFLQEPPQADFLLGVRARRYHRAVRPHQCGKTFSQPFIVIPGSVENILKYFMSQTKMRLPTPICIPRAQEQPSSAPMTCQGPRLTILMVACGRFAMAQEPPLPNWGQESKAASGKLLVMFKTDKLQRKSMVLLGTTAG